MTVSALYGLDIASLSNRRTSPSAYFGPTKYYLTVSLTTWEILLTYKPRDAKFQVASPECVLEF